MKVSRGIANKSNLSNEFVESSLHDSVQYTVAMKNLSEMNQIAERFITKERIIKEKTSLGGFRIPQENLKKRIETNRHDDIIENNTGTNNKYQNDKLSPEDVDKDNYTYDSEKDLGSNLIEIIDKEVEKLKKESAEHLRLIEMNKNSRIKTSETEIDEKKVFTQYLSYNPDRVQAIKHVSTQMKPEYMSLEELQKIKEEHMKKMLEIENEFYEKKRQEEEKINKLSSFTNDDMRYNKLSKLEMKHNESQKITAEELKEIVKNEEEFIMRNKKNEKKKMKERSKSAKAIKRVGISSDNIENPLEKYEERYVKKFAKYMIKKKSDLAEPEPEVESNLTSYNWNKTKIKSQNINGVVNRSDGLPGYIDTDDYSMYYYSIGSNTPKSLSMKSSRSHSRSKSRKLNKLSLNKSYDSQKHKTSLRASTKPNISNMSSHLAFIKLIYSLLDKEKKGIVSKEEIAEELNLEVNILHDLGFTSQSEFISLLNNFPTNNKDLMCEKELIEFLLSKSEIFYLKEGENDKINDILEYRSTNERLDKLKESYSNSLNESKSMNNFNQREKFKNKSFNRNLEKKLKMKINSENEIKVTFKDYKKFVRKFKNKGELNFTIPKPFEFLKKDYSSKKINKIQHILEERKRIEDEILGFRFKPNELKREIFISQFDNLIEAEREKRKYRTEKLKEKIIQEMKPFSFFDNDERKYKEKINKIPDPPQFPPFKANAVPWTSQVTMYDDIVSKMDEKRQARIEQRAIQTHQSAKLPPRMEMHEKKKKDQEQELKIIEKSQTMMRSKSFKANAVPNFSKAHETFMKTMEKKKANAKPTEPVPFNFHEPKKKASLRAYLDKENDPQHKNPQFKRNISEIINKIQQKPKIEPASTKALNLLMATRRKELEERQRKEEEKIIEDKLRKEKQERLKERVCNSKALVDNTKLLEEKRQKQQEDFKRGLQQKKEVYQQELARRLQKVYNKPLMLETTTGKIDKISMNKNIKDKLYEVIYNNNSDEPSQIVQDQ